MGGIGLGIARDDDPRPKYYNFVMFPSPSGDLHIDHWYNYTGADTYGRFMRVQGYHVMQPIASTPSDCPPRTPPASATSIRARGRWTTWPTRGVSCGVWPRPGTGRARSSPACLTIASGRSGSSCSSTSMG